MDGKTLLSHIAREFPGKQNEQLFVLINFLFTFSFQTQTFALIEKCEGKKVSVNEMEKTYLSCYKLPMEKARERSKKKKNIPRSPRLFMCRGISD